MPVELPDREEETAARALVAQAGAALRERRPTVPPTFVSQLYARAVPEDLVRCAAADLAQLAERAWDFLRQRQPGVPKVRCETVTLQSTGEPRSISVVEVVNDDMPFLVDSVMGELADRKLTVRLVAHPVFGVQREGEKLAALGTRDAHPTRESFIHIHLDPLEQQACAELVSAIDTVLAEVRLAVQDWRPMLERVNAIVADLKTNPPPLPVDEIAEAIQFLQWLLADNFTFLGLRDYTCARAICACSSAVTSTWRSRRRSWPS
jgi:glutamate dehydrogenase